MWANADNTVHLTFWNPSPQHTSYQRLQVFRFVSKSSESFPTFVCIQIECVRYTVMNAFSAAQWDSPNLINAPCEKQKPWDGAVVEYLSLRSVWTFASGIPLAFFPARVSKQHFPIWLQLIFIYEKQRAFGYSQTDADFSYWSGLTAFDFCPILRILICFWWSNS